MDFIDQFFARLNLQQIQSFLLSGEERTDISHKDYKSRLDEAWKSLAAVLKQKFPEKEEYEQIACEANAYAGATGDVYMEIGLKCGAALALQFLIFNSQFLIVSPIRPAASAPPRLARSSSGPGRSCSWGRGSPRGCSPPRPGA